MKTYPIDFTDQLMCDVGSKHVNVMPTPVIELYEPVQTDSLAYAVQKTIQYHLMLCNKVFQRR